MAERAQLSRVGRNDHLSISRMFPTGRRRYIQVFSVPLSGRPVADLTFYDLADINAVVDAIGPFCDLLRMARGAIGRTFVVWFLGRNLDDRFPSVVAVLVKRFSSKKFLAPYASTPRTTMRSSSRMICCGIACPLSAIC